ncbi:hypothetical protein Zmor_004235, partial [Zophobas morio]
GRVFNVQVGAALLRAGVPRGSLLSPLLFALYTSNVFPPEHPHTRAIIYANDSVIYSSSKSHVLLCLRLQYFTTTLLLADVVYGTSTSTQHKARCASYSNMHHRHHYLLTALEIPSVF